jgi:hypothetical protein
MTDPAEQPARAYPEARSDDQPEYASKYLAVINLPDAGYEEAKYCRDAWISHFYSPVYDTK